MLPPFCVSIPRTDVPLETIIGVQIRKKEANTRKQSPRPQHTPTDPSVPTARILSDEYTQSELRSKDADEYPSPKDKDKDEGRVVSESLAPTHCATVCP